MSYNLYLRLLNRDGTVEKFVLDDFIDISYRRAVNQPGMLRFTVNADSEIATSLNMYDIVEVYWKNDRLGVPYHLDFAAIIWELEYATDSDGVTRQSCICYGYNLMLGWRSIAYPSGLDNLSKFTAVDGETVIKTLVETNLGSLATTANGRLRDGNLATGMGYNLVIAPNLNRGNLITNSFMGRNVLTVLTQLAVLAGGDFQLNRVSGSNYEFEYYDGQLGAEKISGANAVEFNLSFGNLANPRLLVSKRMESTVAIGAGQGRSTERFFTEVTGDDYSATNDLETFYDQRDQPEFNGVIDVVTSKLKDAKEIIELNFDVIQTAQSFYSPISVAGRKTYDLGDLVRATYQGREFVRKIQAVNFMATATSNQIVNISIETTRPLDCTECL